MKSTEIVAATKRMVDGQDVPKEVRLNEVRVTDLMSDAAVYVPGSSTRPPAVAASAMVRKRARIPQYPKTQDPRKIIQTQTGGYDVVDLSLKPPVASHLVN